jgi:hypothetical protein
VASDLQAGLLCPAAQDAPMLVAGKHIAIAACLTNHPAKEIKPPRVSVDGERAPAKPRLLVLTDIGGDPDDQQSMIRLMTYLRVCGSISARGSARLCPPARRLTGMLVL